MKWKYNLGKAPDDAAPSSGSLPRRMTLNGKWKSHRDLFRLLTGGRLRESYLAKLDIRDEDGPLLVSIEPRTGP